MKKLKIDETWSVAYDPENNDRPVSWFRNGLYHSDFSENNASTSMFYRILVAEPTPDTSKYDEMLERIKEPVHLGDGAYVSYDGYQVWLAANHHENKLVALEPRALTSFKAYLKELDVKLQLLEGYRNASN